MADRCVWMVLPLSWFLTATFSAAGAIPDNSGWSAGATRVDITPKESVWMAGYAARKSPSEGVLRPIAAKALTIRDAEGRTAALITLDLIGVRRPWSDRVKERIERDHGVPREAIVFLTSHTHCGPLPMDTPDRARAYGIDPERTGPNVDYTRRLEDRIVNAVGSALETMAPVRLSFRVGEATFAMNRREPTETGFKIGVHPDGPIDPSVPVLRIEDPQGATRAVVFGYACHNTTLGGEVLNICGDYAGFAQDAIESRLGGDSIALFVAGCGGDINPHPRGTVELAQAHGESLADAVLKVLDMAMSELSGPLRVAALEPALSFAGPTDRASYETRLTDPNPRRAEHARRMIEDIDAGKPPKAEYPYPIQAIALGDRLVLLALAGEVVVDYALRLRDELAGGDPARLWVAAYANDVFGYVPSLRVLREGGYEGGEAFYYSAFPTPFAEDVEEVVVRAARDAVSKVRQP